MCEAIARIKNAARLEGNAEGKLEGLMEGKAEGKTEAAAEFAELADFLVATHRENLLYKMNKDAAFRKQLSLELAQAR